MNFVENKPQKQLRSVYSVLASELNFFFLNERSCEEIYTIKKKSQPNKAINFVLKSNSIIM